MEKYMAKTNNGAVTEYRANVKKNIAPKINEEYTDADGLRMYDCTNEEGQVRQIKADVYDKLWITRPGNLRIAHKNYKGINPCTKIAVLK